jgi:aryl-alcohol dehydrogenase-like predicted oxidoreductase
MRVLHRYLDLGGNFLDTAEVYGPYTNEELLGGDVLLAWLPASSSARAPEKY